MANENRNNNCNNNDKEILFIWCVNIYAALFIKAFSKQKKKKILHCHICVACGKAQNKNNNHEMNT